MVLDGLVAEVERVKATIAAHRELLAGSEALTRYALVDPLLRALEWDTANPALVRPEYRDVSGFADYVLMAGEKPAAVLEAKKLGVALDPKVIHQGLSYCIGKGIKRLALTNGSEWQLYDVFKPVELAEKVTTMFNVERHDAHVVALKALHLWQPNLSAEEVTAPPEWGKGQPGDEGNGKAPTQAPTPQPPPPIPAPSEGWRPLSEVAASIGEISGRPIGLRLPNGVEPSIRAWRGVFTGVGSWLDGQGLLAGKTPLHTGGRGPRYLLNTELRHRDGKGFTDPFKTAGGFYLETNYNASNTVKNTVSLLRHCGVDPATVYLRFGGG